MKIYLILKKIYQYHHFPIIKVSKSGRVHSAFVTIATFYFSRKINFSYDDYISSAFQWYQNHPYGPPTFKLLK